MERSFIRDYVLEIKTLSPIFIGSGESIGKKEYIYDRQNNRIRIPDMRKLYDGLIRMHKIEAYEKYLLHENKDLVYFFSDEKIHPKDYNPWFLYSADVADPGSITRSTKEILTFIKDAAGYPYIPGSSLKGALRTILQSDWYLAHGNEAKRMGEKVKQAQPKSRKWYLADEDKEMDVESMHKRLFQEIKIDNQNNDILRGLIVGDSEPLSLNDLCIAQKIDVGIDGTPKPLNIMRECIKPNVIIRFPVSIDTTVCKYKAKMIVEAMKRFYENYQIEFSGKFSKVPPIRGGNAIFFLGGGAGYVSKTCTYSIVHGRDGQRTVGKILNETLPQKLRRQHGHMRDAERGASPHALKCTRYEKDLMQIGACCVTKMKLVPKDK